MFWRFNLIRESQLFVIVKNDPAELDCTFIVVGELLEASADQLDIFFIHILLNKHHEDGLLRDEFALCLIKNVVTVIPFIDFDKVLSIIFGFLGVGLVDTK